MTTSAPSTGTAPQRGPVRPWTVLPPVQGFEVVSHETFYAEVMPALRSL
jgi:hypothetical protein